MSKLPPLPLMLKSMIPEDQIDVMKWGMAVRAATIEECAKVCESQSNDWASSSAWESFHAARDCAAAIRALNAG